MYTFCKCGYMIMRAMSIEFLKQAKRNILFTVLFHLYIYFVLILDFCYCNFCHFILLFIFLCIFLMGGAPKVSLSDIGAIQFCNNNDMGQGN